MVHTITWTLEPTWAEADRWCPRGYGSWDLTIWWLLIKFVFSSSDLQRLKMKYQARVKDSLNVRFWSMLICILKATILEPFVSTRFIYQHYFVIKFIPLKNQDKRPLSPSKIKPRNRFFQMWIEMKIL